MLLRTAIARAAPHFQQRPLLGSSWFSCRTPSPASASASTLLTWCTQQHTQEHERQQPAWQYRRRSPMSSSAAGATGAATDAAAAASTSAAAPTPAAAVDFITLLTRLKATKRTGWVRSGVEGPESIADHMYRMAVMAMICGGDGNSMGGGRPVDVARCVKMALVHDVAEAIVGDITPHCGVSEGDKHAMEAEAVGRIQEMLGAGTGAGEEVGKEGGRDGDGGRKGDEGGERRRTTTRRLRAVDLRRALLS